MVGAKGRHEQQQSTDIRRASYVGARQAVLPLLLPADSMHAHCLCILPPADASSRSLAQFKPPDSNALDNGTPYDALWVCTTVSDSAAQQGNGAATAQMKWDRSTAPARMAARQSVMRPALTACADPSAVPCSPCPPSTLLVSPGRASVAAPIPRMLSCPSSAPLCLLPTIVWTA